MRAVRLQPVGDVEATEVETLAAGLEAVGFRCAIAADRIDPSFAYHADRGQYHSTAILARLASSPASDIRLAVTAVDLFIPILTFVFGEAQMGGPCAIVSTKRLGQEFYGLPPDGSLRSERLLKEALHEIGHTLGLRHCDDYRCAMASSHAVERIDVKEAAYCIACAGTVRSL
ncbi:MAG: archaemetzincin family Zn-dependent metalloprotease [Acidobacteria bacterium]|nr:archaemetzincin family Zn-dependent metalloprotease [Acidobacteriota bacterium]